jgi:hypothetical protein
VAKRTERRKDTKVDKAPPAEKPRLKAKAESGSEPASPTTLMERAATEALIKVSDAHGLGELAYCEAGLDALSTISEGLEMRAQELRSEEEHGDF